MIILGSVVISLGITAYSLYRVATTPSESDSIAERFESDDGLIENSDSDKIVTEQDDELTKGCIAEQCAEDLSLDTISESMTDILFSPEELEKWGIIASIDQLMQQLVDSHVTRTLDTLEAIVACPAYREDPEGYLQKILTHCSTEGNIEKYLLALALCRLHQHPLYRSRLILLEDVHKVDLTDSADETDSEDTDSLSR